jgi:hypothetical protein
MHHQQVDVVDFERGEALVDRLGEIVRAQVFVADLGGEENLTARHPGGADFRPGS